MNRPTVLAITKRTAELCATQSLLYKAGLDLVAATNMMAARRVLKGMNVKGVIVCQESWTEKESKDIVSELVSDHAGVKVANRCPSCLRCNELTKSPGVLFDPSPLKQLITALAPSSRWRTVQATRSEVVCVSLDHLEEDLEILRSVIQKSAGNGVRSITVTFRKVMKLRRPDVMFSQSVRRVQPSEGRSRG